MDAMSRCNRALIHADTERKHDSACLIENCKVETGPSSVKHRGHHRLLNTPNHRKASLTTLALNQSVKLTVNDENDLLPPEPTYKVQERAVLALQDRQVDQQLRTLRNVVRTATNSVSSNSFRS